MIISKENLQFFQNSMKILSNFWRKFGKRFKISIPLGSEAEPDKANEFIKIFVENSLENCDFLFFSLIFFQSFFEFYRDFCENLGKNLRICICMGFGQFVSNLSRKIKGNLQIFIVLISILPFSKDFQIFSKFSWKFGQKSRKIWK